MDWHEAEYNPRLSVPNAIDFYGNWPIRAEETRAKLLRKTIRYGENPREYFDYFPANTPKGVLIFIHGGYWRAFSAQEFSWVADRFVPLGYSVTVINYPLCPEVSINDIARSCRKAITQFWGELGDERENIIVTGHSAGGYLTAAMLATDWRDYHLPSKPFKAGIAISGVFDLLPLVQTSMNEAIKLSEETAKAWSLHLADLPILCAVGGLETAEFHRQSEAFNSSIIIPNRNHFDVIDELRVEESPLFNVVLQALNRVQPDVECFDRMGQRPA